MVTPDGSTKLISHRTVFSKVVMLSAQVYNDKMYISPRYNFYIQPSTAIYSFIHSSRHFFVAYILLNILFVVLHLHQRFIMRSQTLLGLVAATVTMASPMPRPQGTGSGADSCPSEPLAPKTWTDLKIDDFLAEAAKNYTRTKTNNIQSLADSFGAPNFFCGLDSFCNAGQPCLPIDLPAW